MNCLNRKTNQTGRSMVEMLGVLAVIGVLSVGGLTAYKYTMRRHRITTTIQQVSLAMQSARGLALKKVDSDDLYSDEPDRACLTNINWVMQGIDGNEEMPCKRGGEDGAEGFLTSIGACVYVCRDVRNVWYMDVEFNTDENPDNIITQSDCENILMSEIAKDGFLDNAMNLYSHSADNAISTVCSVFIPSDNDDEETD